MSEISDDELGLRFSRDPERHFQAVYRRYADPLFRFVFRFTGNREAAEEILHDIFIQALAGKFRTETGGGLKAWLFTVARNRSLNHRKATAPLDARVDESFPSAVPDAEMILNQKNLLAKLAVAEAALPADLGQTWSLRKEGLDYRQIAETLGIPVGTVKSRFSRLVELLKEEFGHGV